MMRACTLVTLCLPVARSVETNNYLHIQAKMIYASSKEALKRSLNGIATELQANDADDIEYDTVLKTVSKGLAG